MLKSDVKYCFVIDMASLKDREFKEADAYDKKGISIICKP